jgi:hypothetical protein
MLVIGDLVKIINQVNNHNYYKQSMTYWYTTTIGKARNESKMYEVF